MASSTSEMKMRHKCDSLCVPTSYIRNSDSPRDPHKVKTFRPRSQGSTEDYWPGEKKSARSSHRRKASPVDFFENKKSSMYKCLGPNLFLAQLVIFIQIFLMIKYGIFFWKFKEKLKMPNNFRKLFPNFHTTFKMFTGI